MGHQLNPGNLLNRQIFFELVGIYDNRIWPASINQDQWHFSHVTWIVIPLGLSSQEKIHRVYIIFFTPAVNVNKGENLPACFVL